MRITKKQRIVIATLGISVDKFLAVGEQYAKDINSKVNFEDVYFYVKNKDTATESLENALQIVRYSESVDPAVSIVDGISHRFRADGRIQKTAKQRDTEDIIINKERE